MNIPAISAEVSVRGSCNTPRPFANRVAAALGELAAGILAGLNQRLGGSDAIERQAHAINRLAGFISTVDERDPRLFALMKAYHLLRDPADPKWIPGPEQRRVLAGLGRGTSVETELTELATAAVEDVVAERMQTVSRLENENAALRAQLERLDRYRRLAAEQDVGRLRGEHMTSPFWRQGIVAQELGAAESELAQAQAAESNGEEAAVSTDPAAAARKARLRAMVESESEPVQPSGELAGDEPEKLPTGIRRRASGTLQAFFRDASGKQQAQGGFATVEEAVQYRDARLTEVAARKATKERMAA